jgi:Predicted transcriptional regulators
MTSDTCVWCFSAYGDDYAASTTCGSSFIPNKHDLLVGRFYEFCPRCGKHIRFVGLDELSNKLIKDSTYSKDRLYAKFRTFLLSKRLESGLSVSDFAKKCNISGSAIRNYESRGCLPSVPELLRIAHALNTSVYEIFDIKKPGDEANESL